MLGMTPPYDEQLVRLRHARRQHRPDKGVSAQEQEGVAGVVVVMVGRSFLAARPHGAAAAILTLNLAPHDPFRMPACAPPSLVAAGAA